MKITLKTIILIALFVFYLVIIFSNFTHYEGMDGSSEEKKDEPKKDATGDMKKVFDIAKSLNK